MMKNEKYSPLKMLQKAISSLF